MLILVMMLLIGLFAGVWGFLMCFFPARWDKLTEAISFAGRWTEPSPKRLHPLLRFGNRIGGLAILAVGCWFAYMAALEIHLVLTGRATTHTLPPTSGTLPNTAAPGITALSIFVVVAGILMAVFPAKAVAVFEHVWPAGRSVAPSAAPKVMLFVRLCGVFFAFLNQAGTMAAAQYVVNQGLACPGCSSIHRFTGEFLRTPRQQQQGSWS